MKVLVAGATGLLGGEICQRLAAKGHKVRAMIRPTSDPAGVERLRTLGIELVSADLKDPTSLGEACRGVDAVVSTATSTRSRQEGDSIETVDLEGQMSLIAAARKAQVGKYLYTSISGNIREESPFRNAKRKVEQRLQESGLAYTILRPSYFMEVWLSPAVGFDYARSAATIYGSGDHRLSWISYHNVAEFAVNALEHPSARNRIIELGGPQALSPLEVVRIFEKQSGTKFNLEHVPEEALRQQRDSAADSLQKSFSGLMLSYAHGDEVPMAETLREFPIPLTSVEQYARVVTAATPKQ